MLQRHTDSLSHASFDDSDSHDVQHEHEACSKDAMMSLLIAADYIKDLQQVVTDRDCSDNESSQEEDQNETDHKPGDESEENENGDGEDEDGAKEEGESPSDTPSVVSKLDTKLDLGEC